MRTLAWTFAACTAGFFAVGWLASVESTMGLSWRPFDPVLGFGFAAAFAQLVLAGVVWAQIRGTNDALVHARSAAADAAARQNSQRAADALATFVGCAANSSALYSGTVMLRLRDVVLHPADSTYVDAASNAAAIANQARQAAHAERFHIRVRTSDGGAEEEAAKEFLALIDRQHQCALRIIGWSRKLDTAGAPAPPIAQRPSAQSIYADPEQCRKRCLDLASALLRP